MKKLLVFSLISTFFALATLLPQSTAHAAADDPDKNIKLRGWEPVTGQLRLIPFSHPIDSKAPQLSTLIAEEARPAITSLYNVYEWDWANNRRDGLYPRPNDLPPGFDFATLVGFEANGKNILVPESGYTLGGGFEVFVLYADDDRITLKYTCEDDVVEGYTIHLIGFKVDPGLLALYNQLDTAGRAELPILKAGMILGRGTGELLVSIRDTGSFMDPRWENDWWQRTAAATGQALELTSRSLAECGGGPRRGCENPLDGPKDRGCYRGAEVQNSNPIISSIGNVLRAIFRWGGEDQKIEITKQTIPVKGDLPYLLGRFPFGTPETIDDAALEVFEDGVVPKLTPPGDQLETLHTMLPSYLEDYSKVETEAILDKAVENPDEDIKQTPQLSAPDIWGLANTAIRLAFNLVEPPGTNVPGYAFKVKDNALNTTYAANLVPQGELQCENKTAFIERQEPRQTNIKLARNVPPQDNSNFNVSLTAATASCDATTADDKPLCIREGEGVFAEKPEEQACPISFEEEICQAAGQEVCLNSPSTVECAYAGEVINCVIYDPNQCSSSTSTSGVDFTPKVSFLPDYTQYIIETYRIFKTPGLKERKENEGGLYGEGKEFEWTFGGQQIIADDKILYKKLGTVECLENYVKRSLAPPGHNIPEKTGCFE